MARLIRSTILTIVAVALTVGCEGLEPPTTAVSPGDEPARDASTQGRAPTLDEEFARVARSEVPGFAGYYLLPDGTPVVRLTDPRQRGAAERYLARQRIPGGRGARVGAAPRAVFRDAAFDFAALAEWAAGLHPLLARDDVYTLDVDEVENRVVVGVRDEDGSRAVRAAASALGIPAVAVEVETQPAPERRQTLRDHTSVLRGGFQIASPSWPCTLGFIAIRGGVQVMVTASHCTQTSFGFDGGPIRQPTWTDGVIGSEIADRPFYHCAITHAHLCRYSDAAIIAWNGARSVQLGTIARTPWATGGPGGLALIGTYRIQARRSHPVPVGTWLDKTGRTTGTTYGQVTRSCVTIGSFLCQDVSRVWSQVGDSGSPMYVWLGGDGVALQGILWGGPADDHSTTYSSPLGGIEADLGALAYVCIYGYGC